MSDEQKEQVQGNVLVPVRAEDLLPGRAVPRVLTYLNPNNKADQAKAANALALADYSCKDVEGDEFEIVNLLCHNVDIADRKTGEVRPAVRSVLFMPSGETVGFVSIGVYSCLQNFIAVRGTPPWSPPLKVKVIRKKASVGETILLTLVE